MRKNILDVSLFILIFLFTLFTLSNIGFLFHCSIKPFYILLSSLVPLFYIFKCDKKVHKILLIALVFLVSFICSNFFIDTSFDGRAYHFTLEKLFVLGFNPFYDNIYDFADKNNLFSNLLFASSYPNAIELLRANFYLVFNNMEVSKTVNFLIMFFGVFYSFYFFSNKLNYIKSSLLSVCVLLCSVVIGEINTKMVDFCMYFFFLAQLFSGCLILKNKDLKQNSIVFVLASVLSIASKYTGILNTFIIFSLILIFKRNKIFIKSISLVLFLSLVLCLQPYLTNIIKFKNPLYPSIGHNKLDFMTKQNPIEFQNKPYIYKFFRSMFSSSSDARIGNPETPRLFYKIPFTIHNDLPYIAEETRISGFGHLFSGIFILSVFFTIYQIRKKKGIFLTSCILLTVFLNPICWWARFVPQLHLLPILNCFYLRKNKIIFYLLTALIFINGIWLMKENFLANAYRTYIVNGFYNDLYQKSLKNKALIYIDKTPLDEDDTTILSRLDDYGVNYEVVKSYDDEFKDLNMEFTISKAYKIKFEK